MFEGSYMIVTSDGIVHTYNTVNEFIDGLDEFGPEVAETFEPCRNSHGDFIPLDQLVKSQA